MQISELFKPSSAGVAFTVILVVTVVFEDGLWGQRDDFFAVRMDDDRRIGLKAIGDLAGLWAHLFQTCGGRELLGHKVSCPIAGDEMVAIEVDHIFQGPAPLSSAENLVEGWTQGIQLNWIKPRSHLGVTRSPFYSEDGLEIVRFGDSSTVECKEARILESKHRIARHEAIRQGDGALTIAWWLRNLLEGFSH